MTDNAADLVLPVFQGERPRHAKMQFTGQSDACHAALDLDTEIVVVARVRCRGITHKRDKDDVLGRAETLEVTEAYELHENSGSDAVLKQAREESEALKRRVFGGEPGLFD